MVNVRVEAAKLLATFPAPDAATVLAQALLNDADVKVRTACAEALGVRMDPASVEWLERSKSLDESDQVQAASAAALRQYQH